MAVPHLGGAPAVPLEGRHGIGRQWRRVSLDQGDLVPVATQREGGPQPRHSGTHHHDSLALGPHDD